MIEYKKTDKKRRGMIQRIATGVKTIMTCVIAAGPLLTASVDMSHACRIRSAVHPAYFPYAPGAYSPVQSGAIRDSATLKSSDAGKAQTHTNAKRKEAMNGEHFAGDSTGFEDEYDLHDNDMYIPYPKWRIDKFDNWGKKKRHNPSLNENDTTAIDTGAIEKKKGFSDDEKESLLFFQSPCGYFSRSPGQVTIPRDTKASWATCTVFRRVLFHSAT